jgi:hypothetical protein
MKIRAAAKTPADGGESLTDPAHHGGEDVQQAFQQALEHRFPLR